MSPHYLNESLNFTDCEIVYRITNYKGILMGFIVEEVHNVNIYCQALQLKNL